EHSSLRRGPVVAAEHAAEFAREGGDHTVRVNFANAVVKYVGDVEIAHGVNGHAVRVAEPGVGGRTSVAAETEKPAPRGRANDRACESLGLRTRRNHRRVPQPEDEDYQQTTKQRRGRPACLPRSRKYPTSGQTRRSAPTLSKSIDYGFGKQ